MQKIETIRFKEECNKTVLLITCEIDGGTHIADALYNGPMADLGFDIPLSWDDDFKSPIHELPSPEGYKIVAWPANKMEEKTKFNVSLLNSTDDIRSWIDVEIGIDNHDSLERDLLYKALSYIGVLMSENDIVEKWALIDDPYNKDFYIAQGEWGCQTYFTICKDQVHSNVDLNKVTNFIDGLLHPESEYAELSVWNPYIDGKDNCYAESFLSPHGIWITPDIPQEIADKVRKYLRKGIPFS